jgi:protein-disulfide isomerase
MSDKEVSKRQQRKEQIRRKERNSRLLAIGLVSVGVLFIAFLFIYPNIKPVDAVIPAEEYTYPNADFNKLGKPDAPIKIDEYADFQCPFCRVFFEQTEKLLMDNYIANGTVYFEFHTFGEFIGPESVAAAQAAYCAGDQDKFWQMNATIFTNQTGENVGAFNDRRLEAFAQEIGLNMDVWSECYNSGKYSDRVEQDGADALAAGVQSTPAFVLTYEVNGETKTRIIEGARAFDVFQTEIEAALAEMNQ